MDPRYAEFILKKNRTDYNKIAKDFSRTRTYLSRDLQSMASEVNHGTVLDIGCGNGRLAEAFSGKDVTYYGIDVSEELIDIAREKHPGSHFSRADSTKLPFQENFFDQVFSIAVLHHIPSKKLQLAHLTESFRVLKPGGKLSLRVWNLWHVSSARKNIFISTMRTLFGMSHLDFFDIFYPWKDARGNVVTERYFHCFRKNELQKLAERAGYNVEKIGESGGETTANIYVIARKPT